MDEKHQPVVGNISNRMELRKIAYRLQNQLALALFKTQHGWENFTLDSIEQQLEEQGALYDSSCIASNTLDSPLATRFFSSGIRSKLFHRPGTSSSERFVANKRMGLARPSRIISTRQMRLTDSNGSYVPPFWEGRTIHALSCQNFGAPPDDDPLTAHSVNISNASLSAPRTPPPMPTRSLIRRHSQDDCDAASGGTADESLMDMLLHPEVASSPSVMSNRAHISTPPPKASKTNLYALTVASGQESPSVDTSFNYAEFINLTPSPVDGPSISAHTVGT